MADYYTTEEGTLLTPDNVALYTKTWIPTTQRPRARLAFIHGFSDHSNFYDPLFPSLAQHGIQTHAFDQRGWGRSVATPKQRGLTGGTQQVMDDMTLFLEHILNSSSGGSKEEEEHAAPAPLFLMGHSMGGGQVLYYAATGPRSVRARIRGYLAEAPFIALHAQARPWRTTVLLGRLAGKLLPQMQMVQKLDARHISRDAEVCRAWEADALNHDTGTLAGLAGMLDRAGELESGAVKVSEGEGEGGKTRLWVGFGTGDQVLSEEACRRWFDERVPVRDKEYRVYEGWYHKLHAEPGEDKVVFARDVAKWILDRSEPLESETAAKAKL